MKQLHLPGKLACALIATVAFISGCQKKNQDTPPVPEATASPSRPTPAPATPQPTTPQPGQTDPNAPAPTRPPPTTTEPPPPATR